MLYSHQRNLVFAFLIAGQKTNIEIVDNLSDFFDENRILILFLVFNNSTFNYYSILIKQGKRDSLKDFLLSNGISVAIYYPNTLPSLPAHSSKESFPVSEKVCTEILSLPIWPGIQQSQLDYVIEIIHKYFPKHWQLPCLYQINFDYKCNKIK